MTERGRSVDYTTVWRWVQQLRSRTRPAGAAGVETDGHVRASRRDLCSRRRALDVSVPSPGLWCATLDFYLSAKRDAAAAKQFLGKVLAAPNHPRPRVIKVDGNPSYLHAVSNLLGIAPGKTMPLSSRSGLIVP
jgi:IS6 family transposase